MNFWLGSIHFFSREWWNLTCSSCCIWWPPCSLEIIWGWPPLYPKLIDIAFFPPPPHPKKTKKRKKVWEREKGWRKYDCYTFWMAMSREQTLSGIRWRWKNKKTRRWEKLWELQKVTNLQNIYCIGWVPFEDGHVVFN